MKSEEREESLTRICTQPTVVRKPQTRASRIWRGTYGTTTIACVTPPLPSITRALGSQGEMNTRARPTVSTIRFGRDSKLNSSALWPCSLEIAFAPNPSPATSRTLTRETLKSVIHRREKPEQLAHHVISCLPHTIKLPA